MNVSYTIHVAGVSHHMAAELLADMIYDVQKRAFDHLSNLESLGRYVESNPIPVRPSLIHNDREMDSAMSFYFGIGELDRFVRSACMSYPDVSVIWWKVEDLEGDSYSLQCWFYTSALPHVGTGHKVIRCGYDAFDELLPLHLNELLAVATSAYGAKYDVNRNVILLLLAPVEVPQCEWVDPRINPFFRGIIEGFIPKTQIHK